ncbi:MAG: Uma2 family endonuclease [Gloeotrichia echinulata IR180]|jgi:Uma2 family endonuclease|nr:Uma2 family endonuclease [Gloeotrichia echinulata DEX184]
MTQIQPLQKLFTFDEFIEWYPENSQVRYELHKGLIIEMPPATGDHTFIILFLLQIILSASKFNKSLHPASSSVIVKTPNEPSAYIPDILVINQENLVNEPLWKKESTLIYPESIPLLVEVVSTNWQDDYEKKFNDYEAMGIREYWIVDYAALGGRKYIGKPKVPTIFVCELIDGEYQMSPFRGTNCIASPTFPQLNITAQQIFDSVI